MKQYPVLTLFHPLITEWFLQKFAEPTDIQQKAWPVIAKGEHVLITAPTGSGKTLTAFLWSLNKLITGQWPEGSVHVLYISPLRALNTDVQRNLITPLKELKEVFQKKGEKFPGIRVLTRSGDTPQSARRKMLTHPPEILITTPESLNLMISSPRARDLFTSIKTIIMDEIHSIAQARRGTHMITAVDRIIRLSGEFQRIALSATVKPLNIIADFVAGYRIETRGTSVTYTKREVKRLSSDRKKPVFITVEFPQNARDMIVDNTWWPALIKIFKERIAKNRSTLLFTNTRKLSEKITSFINENEPGLIAYAHHGSLSKEIRSLVETKLKNGELKAIVATSSLELGIDIGDLDEVILIESPPAVSSGLQRIGRAGHGVDDVIRGVIYPTHGKDFLLAAIMAKCIMEKDIEEVIPVTCPLDVLAQVIISMTCMEEWDKDALYRFIRTSYPYHTLIRLHFDITINMLIGKYSETRIRELKPRISYDRIDNTLKGKKGSLALLYLSGGTIPDRGYFDLKVSGSDRRIGNLDEEFVWERRVGHVFCLGTQAWKIVSIDHKAVEVIPWETRTNAIPFWKADKRYADFHFLEKAGMFLEKWNDGLENPEFLQVLLKDYYMTIPAAEELINFCKRQKDATNTDLPHRHHLLIEHCTEGVQGQQDIQKPNRIQNTDNEEDLVLQGQKSGNSTKIFTYSNTEIRRVIIHTLWGGKINYPFSLAIAAAWQEQFNYSLEVFSNDFCIMILLPHSFNAQIFLELVHPDSIEDLLRKKLETTGFFGALFRENAGRALLLPRMDFNKRLPLWLTRLRAKKLYDAVLGYSDFPVLLETWRSCFSEEFDLHHLKTLLKELREGEICITEVHTQQASPFASDLIWRQTDKHMYEDDAPSSGRISHLSDDILKEIITNRRLRPRIKTEIIAAFVKKVQRTLTGYSPSTTEDLLEWIKERIIIPIPEWEQLIDSINSGSSSCSGCTFDGKILSAKAVKIRLPHSSIHGIIAIETFPRLMSGLSLSLKDITILPLEHESTDKNTCPVDVEYQVSRLLKQYPDKNTGAPVFDDLFSEWCRYYGPLTFGFIEQVFGIQQSNIKQMGLRLAERRIILIDEITEGITETEICDSENFERLLRLSRKKAKPVFKALPASHLPLFCATWQGITSPGTGLESFKKILEQLFGYPAPLGIWETDIFGVRIKDYSPRLLDSLLLQSDLIWFGCKKNYLSFTLTGDIDLFCEYKKNSRDSGADKLFPHLHGKYTFWEILDHTNMSTQELTKTIWNAVWRGLVSNESFEVIRKGIQAGFRPASIGGNYSYNTRRTRRIGYNRWKTSRPVQGAWFHLPIHFYEEDRLFYEELKKERVRQLLLRYGILFRHILITESAPFQWKELFKTLYLMELSGEILSGYFFEGVQGPQFISKDAYDLLVRGLDNNCVYWMNSCDPAYPYDVLKTHDRTLPFRHPSTHIVFHGYRPVLISRKKGKECDIRVDPGDRNISCYAGLFHFLLNRKPDPLKAIRLEKINDQPISKSDYCDSLVSLGFRKDYNRLILRGRY